MKRVKSACIFQTLVFFQKPEPGYSKEKALKLNREELQKYKEALEHAKNRYQIDDTLEQEDGSLVVHVRKQYTDKPMFPSTSSNTGAACDFQAAFTINAGEYYGDNQ